MPHPGISGSRQWRRLAVGSHDPSCWKEAKRVLGCLIVQDGAWYLASLIFLPPSGDRPKVSAQRWLPASDQQSYALAERMDVQYLQSGPTQTHIRLVDAAAVEKGQVFRF